jgi:hypothetical protein
MYPIPNKSISLNNWIDSLESTQILSLLQLWNENSDYEELTGILICLKDKFKNSNIINQYYENSIKNILKNETNIENDSLFDPNIIPIRIKNSSNCGRSQCEFRHNGCNHGTHH